MPKKISEGAFTERERVSLDPAENEPVDHDEIPEAEPIAYLYEDTPQNGVEVVKNMAGETVAVFGAVDADVPDHNTSHYGWALWHLEMAHKHPDIAAATYHALAAQARATLHQANIQDPNAEGPYLPTTWSAS